MYSRSNTEEPVVPPHRLGELLCEARLKQGLSLDAAASELGPDWSALTLLEVETGYRSLPDQDLLTLTNLYQVATAELIPSRSHLVLEIDDRMLNRGNLTVHFVDGEDDEHEVLTRYLAALYAMRGIEPGQILPLRQPDLHILSEALGRPAADIEHDLIAMMVSSEEAVRTRGNRIRNRVLIPALGVIVAVTAVGILLMVSDDSSAAGSGPAGDRPSVTSAVPVDIGDAVVQERLPDGSPGEVLPRG